MISFADVTLEQYLDRLAAREPIPGGGSVAALSGALGAALIEMVLRYSLGKGKPADVENNLQLSLSKAGKARWRLLALTGEDAQAYLNLRQAKNAGEVEQKMVRAAAAAVPAEVVALCEQCLQLLPFIRVEGNMYLLSDVTAAEGFLQAGVAAARAMVEANQ